MSKSDPVTERYHEANLHGSPQELLAEDNANWLANRDETTNAAVRVYRIRHENPKLALAVSEAVQSDEYRPIIVATAQDGGKTIYDEIEPFMQVSRRTVKARVRELVDNGVVSVDSDAKPAVVAFPSDVVELLVKDALSLYFTTTNNMK